jgi:hypothetical protein
MCNSGDKAESAGPGCLSKDVCGYDVILSTSFTPCAFIIDKCYDL